jgi:hypothetical protein
MMSPLLTKVLQKAQTLLEVIQDELAEQFIEDIENEIKSFSRATQILPLALRIPRSIFLQLPSPYGRGAGGEGPF